MKTLIILCTLFLSNLCLSVEAVTKLEQRGGLYFEEGEQSPFTGIFRETYDDGKPRSEISYESGLPVSINVWYENGVKRQSAPIEKGQLHGTVTWWYANGQASKKEEYLLGIRHGSSISYHPSGERKESENFVNGNLIGLTTSWHPNGQKESEATYQLFGRVGVRVGKRNTWHSNGQKASEGHYTSSGKFDGLFTDWHENGQKAQEATYNNGRLVGSITEWDKEGKKLPKDGSDFPFLNGELNLRYEKSEVDLSGEVVEIKYGPKNERLIKINLHKKGISDIWVFPLDSVATDQIAIGDRLAIHGSIRAVDSFRGIRKKNIQSTIEAVSLLLALKIEM